jgi:hypothetical protein
MHTADDFGRIISLLKMVNGMPERDSGFVMHLNYQ